MHVSKNQMIALVAFPEVFSEHTWGSFDGSVVPPTTLRPYARGNFSLSRAITYLKKCYSEVFGDFSEKTM
jgi:hypothetical protein